MNAHTNPDDELVTVWRHADAEEGSLSPFGTRVTHQPTSYKIPPPPADEAAETPDAGLVLAGEGQAYTTSLLIAERFGKQHKDVLKAIRNLDCSAEFNGRNFAPIEIPIMVGFGIRNDPAYQITRDGFAFLAMGFTGKAAAYWKEQFITAFNQMEALLRDTHHHEHQALLNALFACRPQWRDTQALVAQGLSNREIARVQNKHVGSVKGMLARMRRSGLHIGQRPLGGTVCPKPTGYKIPPPPAEA